MHKNNKYSYLQSANVVHHNHRIARAIHGFVHYLIGADLHRISAVARFQLHQLVIPRYYVYRFN